MPMSAREFNINKESNFSSWYNEILYAADLVDIRYNVQGFVVHRPWAMQAIKQLYKLFETELELDNHLPVLFPTLIPQENLEKEKDHFAGFVPNVFTVTHAGEEELKRKLVLRPTSETAFYQLFNLWIQSRSDLPMKLYQSCSVFRYEKETTPFMRGREFLWIETHDVFETREQAQKQVEKDIEISLKVMTKLLGVPLTVFQRPQWDKFPGADFTYAYDVLMPDGKVLQAGATHLLGTHFTKAFDVKFKDSDGTDVYPQTTCFGPGIWRMIAAIISIHGDDKGLIFPPLVAPIQVVIVPIFKETEDSKSILDLTNQIARDLAGKGFRVTVDDTNKTPGYKFNYWEMKGVPLRIEIGAKECVAKIATFSRRDVSRSKRQVSISNILEEVTLELDSIYQTLSDKASVNLAERTYGIIKSKEELKRILDAKSGLITVPFCTISIEGKDCGEQLQAYTNGGKVRGLNVNLKIPATKEDKCIICGNVAKEIVFVARQY